MSRSQTGPRGRLAVIGLGVNGLSAAYAAAKLGYQVHGYDRAPIGDDSASSLGIGKIVRFGYLDDFFARLMIETDERWQEVERATGTRLWERVGTVQWGTVAGYGLAAVERSLAVAGREHRIVEADDPLLKRLGLSLRADEAAVWEPAGGYMRPADVIAALRRVATEAGATLSAMTPVTAIDGQGDDLAVSTRSGTARFDRVIVAAGHRILDFLPRLAPAVRVSRQYQIVARSEQPVGDGSAWSWLDVGDNSVYGMTNIDPGRHVIGLHLPDDFGDSDRVIDPAARDAAAARLKEILSGRLSGAAVEVEAVRTCHYTNTPTEDFVIAAHPADPRIVMLSACSGHGFKFGITSGYYAAQVADGAPVPERFSLFAGGRLGRSDQ